MLRVIVAFNRENHEYERFRDQGDQAVDARVRLTVRQTVFKLGVSLVTASGTALVLGVGAQQVLQGRLTVGQLLVLISYIAAVYKPLETISSTINMIQEKLISAEMALGLLDHIPEVIERPEAVTLPRVTGAVSFRDVSFSYSGRGQTLDAISFDVRAGETVAIVGPTGAGKSTLVSLLPRFYDPADGLISVDGVDLRDVTLSSLRGQISIVLQEPLLFTGTILENIRYGRLNASFLDVKAAAEAANAHEFIQRLPQKYQTKLGERGAKISGGERQRICVARAFLKDAPILILDEPTSSIDTKTEGVILDALDRLMIGRTTFLIAHRLSTIRHADTILVVDRGQIVQAGTHDELLGKDGVYRQLHDAQQRGAASGSNGSTGQLEKTG
jgi:ABC-type multidrug transport system fused ATPase/permease subunit